MHDIPHNKPRAVTVGFFKIHQRLSIRSFGRCDKILKLEKNLRCPPKFRVGLKKEGSVGSPETRHFFALRHGLAESNLFGKVISRQHYTQSKKEFHFKSSTTKPVPPTHTHTPLMGHLVQSALSCTVFLFNFFYSLHPIKKLSVKQGRVFLG